MLELAAIVCSRKYSHNKKNTWRISAKNGNHKKELNENQRTKKYNIEIRNEMDDLLADWRWHNRSSEEWSVENIQSKELRKNNKSKLNRHSVPHR